MSKAFWHFWASPIKLLDVSSVPLGVMYADRDYSLHSRHNERDGVSSRLFAQSFVQSQIKTSKLRVTGLCERNYSHLASGFSPKRTSRRAQMTEKVKEDLVVFLNFVQYYKVRLQCCTYLIFNSYHNVTNGHEFDWERIFHNVVLHVWIDDLCARSRYKGQGQVIPSNKYGVM